jgi:hypothetical protein
MPIRSATLEDSDKIPLGRTSIYILHFFGWEITAHPLAEVWAAKIWQRAISGTGSGWRGVPDSTERALTVTSWLVLPASSPVATTTSLNREESVL